MKKNIVDLNQNFTSIKEISLLLHKTSKFNQIIEDYIQKNALNETISFLFPNNEKRPIRIFHYGTKEGKKFGLYIYNKALLPFLKKHQENLIELGVERERIYALLNIIPSLSVDEKTKEKDNLLLIGKIATKFTNNPRVTCLLTKYIKDTFLTATYPALDESTGAQIQKNMFCFSPSVRGRSAVYLVKEALPFFLKKYQTHLKEKALEFDQEHDFISLRGFSLMLGKNNKEKELFQFIQNYLDETFELQDETGALKTVRLFTSVKHGSCFYINIHKKGLPSFIKKHHKELVQMGFFMADVIAQTPDKKDFLKNFKQVNTLIKKLSSIKEMQEKIMALIEKTAKNQTLANKEPLLLNYKNTLFVKKENIPLLFQINKENLLKLGINQPILENLISEAPFKKRTPEMLTFKDVAARLKSDYARSKPLFALLKRCVETETFASKEDITENSFICCKSQRSFLYALKNEQAFHSFLKNHKEELIQIGFKKEMVEHLSGEKEYPLISDDFIYLNNLKEYLHIDDKNFKEYILQNCLEDKYQDETGVSKPMFPFMRGKRHGFGDYAIDKKALKQFVQKYANAFKIKKIVAESIFFDKPLHQKKDSYITLTTLTELLGMTTRRTEFLANAVKKYFIHDKVQIDNKPCPVFSFAYTISGQMTLYADELCLPAFLLARKNDLQALGFKKEKIEQFVQKIQKEPWYIHNKITHQKLKKLVYLNTHPTNRQRGSN